MERITDVTVGGVSYTLNLSVKAFVEITEIYGGLQNAFDAIRRPEDDGKGLTDPAVMTIVIDIAALLMDQGAKYKKQFEDVDSTALTRDQIWLLPNSEYYKLYVAVYTAMLMGGARTVETEPDPKNADATQE